MRIFTMVVLLASLMSSALYVTPVHAASIVVNSNADTVAKNDGKCTLREAIIAATSNGPSGSVPGECAAGSSLGVDSISFADNYTITVGSQLPYITTAVSITGRGAANTIIQASESPNTAAWRVLQVTSTGNLTLDQVTIRNGKCDGFCTVVGGIRPNHGGGIYNSGILIIRNSTISGNKGGESDGTGGGGGLYNNGGTVTVVNSIFSENSSSSYCGGGIYNTGSLTITNSAFSGNFVISKGTGIGGGIYNTGSLTVSGSTFSNNAGTIGGAIMSTAGDLIVTNSFFTGNTASSGTGGGIHKSGTGTLTVTNSTFANNTATDGGGIYNTGSLLILTNSTFLDNEANRGGGLFTYSINSTVANSTFLGNSASSGGGIFNWYILSIANSTISGNSASSGGGIYNDGSTTILKNVIVANNSGDNCFGIITNGGNNLESSNTCGWGISEGSLSNTDPKLDILSSNGGPTQTMKLLVGSPAIDKGNSYTCTASPVNSKDQRGVNRPLGSGCDIGAYETTSGSGPDTVGVFRPINGIIFLKNLNISGFADVALNYGIGGDYPLVGDWDGDGDDTIGVYRNGSFLLRNSNTLGFADYNFIFGQAGDQPIAGDWDGDGIDTVGVYRTTTGAFYLRNTNSAGAPDASFYLGNVGDVGIAGDWNGDGMDTTGVFRPSNGVIFLKNTNKTGFADLSLNYGIAGDKPVMGDWDANGTTTTGIYRNARFYLRNSNTNGIADIVFELGNLGDMPIAGNWDGNPN